MLEDDNLLYLVIFLLVTRQQQPILLQAFFSEIILNIIFHFQSHYFSQSTIRTTHFLCSDLYTIVYSHYRTESVDLNIRALVDTTTPLCEVSMQIL